MKWSPLTPRARLLFALYGAGILIAAVQMAVFRPEPISVGAASGVMGGAFAYWLLASIPVWAQRSIRPRPWGAIAVLALFAFFVTVGSWPPAGWRATIKVHSAHFFS